VHDSDEFLCGFCRNFATLLDDVRQLRRGQLAEVKLDKSGEEGFFLMIVKCQPFKCFVFLRHFTREQNSLFSDKTTTKLIPNRVNLIIKKKKNLLIGNIDANKCK
jgi:hypothetical protein